MKLYVISYTYRKVREDVDSEVVESWSYTGNSMVEVREKLESLKEIFLVSGYEITRWYIREIENTV